MANKNLENYKKVKLTNADLDKYSKKLNSIYNELSLAIEKYYEAKREYNLKNITKDQLLEVKKVYKELNLKFKETKSTRVFLDNLKNIEKIEKAEPKDSEDYSKILKEKQIAQKLYKEFKEVVKEKGKYGSLSKLSPYAVEVENLKFRYNEDQPYVIKDVNFKIEHGDYVAIVGHNGSGKSTLSKLLIGVLTADKGKISIFGNTLNPQNIDRIRQFLGIVFQNPDNQFIGSTVKDDIAFGLENKKVDPKDMQGIIERSAARVGMEKFLDKEPLMLSGGQKQRVAIASTLALDPEIIIFDEATSMLDPKGKKEIKEIMVNLKNQGNKTILSITHDMDEILNASKVLVMNGGELIRMGTPQEIMSDRKFLKSIHLDMPFVGVVEDALVEAGVDIKIGSKDVDELVDKIWKA